jgi:hypothetical protein
MLDAEGLTHVKRVFLVGLVWLVAAVQAVRPEAELVLRDGRILRGEEVRREGDLYLLELGDGEKLAFPASLVEEVRLGGEGREEEPPTGLRRGQPETLAGSVPDESAPSGLRSGEPRTLAGTEVRPPRPAEQTRNLGAPARFQEDIVDSRWTPESDWDMNPSRNDFSPSTWSEAPIDPEWKPRSAFDAKADVLDSGRSEWQESIVDPGWQPTDAFAGRSAF